MVRNPAPQAYPTSSQTLIDYAFRALGAPVIKINVDPQQAADRLWEAVQYMTQYSDDFKNRRYVVHQITQQDTDNGYIDLTQAAGIVSISNGSNVVTGYSTNFVDDFSTIPGVTQITIQGTTANVTGIANNFSLTTDVVWSNTANNLQATIVQAEDRFIGINRVLPMGSAPRSNNILYIPGSNFNGFYKMLQT